MKANFINGANSALLEQFQSENELFLPNGYYRFLLKTNGVIFPEKTMFKVEGLGEEIALDSLFGIIPERKWLDLNYENKEYKDELPSGGLVIGRDVLGGHLIMLCDGDDKGIYYWDDAFNFPKSKDDSNAYMIAKSFEDFVDLLGGIEEKENSENLNDNILPLGSVVILHGGIQKLLIVSRAINVKNNGKKYFFDYGAVLYPDGLVSDQMAYFNQKDIENILFEGCKDNDNDMMINAIHEYKKNNPNIIYGNTQDWKK